MTDAVQPGEHHFKIAETAAEKLRAAFDGNGLAAGQIKLLRHDTSVHALPGTITVTIKPGFTKTQRKGRHPQGEELRAREMVIAKIEGQAATVLASPAAQQNIAQMLAADAGKGWEMAGAELPLPGTKQDFCHVETCKRCHGNAKIDCVTCQATGETPCQACAGQGGAPCAFCFGTGQFKRADGSLVPCTRCQGVGRGVCGACQGRKTVQCRMCNGLLRVDCVDCGGSGWWTHIYTTAYAAVFAFAFDRSGSNTAVLELLDKMGSRAAATLGHAEIIVEPAKPNAPLHVTALFPVSTAEYQIEGKTVEALVAGLKGSIVKIEPVLDAYVKPAMLALMKVGKGGMAQDALLATARKTRLTRETLQALPGLGKRRVYEGILASYGPVLSDKYARAVVKYASDALNALGRGPRLKGLGVGTALAGVLGAGWFMTGARGFALALLREKGFAQHILALDIAAWVMGWGIAVLAIRMMATAAVRKLLPPEGRQKMLAAGDVGMYALFTTFIVWLGVAALAPERAEWLVEILKKIGI